MANIVNSTSIGRRSTIAVTVAAFEKAIKIKSRKLKSMQTTNAINARINMHVCLLFISCLWRLLCKKGRFCDFRPTRHYFKFIFHANEPHCLKPESHGITHKIVKRQRVFFWVCFLSCLLCVVSGRAENAPAKPAPAAADWIIPELPRPDSGGWIHLFDGNRLYGSTPQSSDSQSGTVQLKDGLLRVDSATVQFNLDCNDLDFRARLKKTSARYVRIFIRNTTKPAWRGCTTIFDGGGKFFTGKNNGDGLRELIETNVADQYNDFFDLEIIAIGNTLTLKANGKVIYSVEGSSLGYGAIRINAVGGSAVFKSIEAKILDEGPEPPDLPNPDADGWFHMFDGKRFYGYRPPSSDSQSGAVRLDDGLLRLDSAVVEFNLDCHDLDFRARLKKTSAHHVAITVRNTTWPSGRGCATFFRGGSEFETQKFESDGMHDLIKTNTPGQYDDFFNLEITAIGDKLTLKADGKVIYSVADSSVGYGNVRIRAVGGTVLFKSIEVKDLDKGPNPRNRFVQAVEANFTRWDKDHNGQLDEAEITAAIQDPNVKGDDAAAAAALKGVFVASNDGEPPALTEPFFQSRDPRLEMLAAQFQYCLTNLQSASGLPIFTRDSPTFAECKQGRIGDCYLVALLGASLARNPAAVRQMITPDDQIGGYHVFFPDGTRVDTPALTDGELAWVGQGPAQCLWERTLEKAWGLRKICRENGASDPSIDPFDTVAGGSGENMLLSLTGHQTADYYFGKRGKPSTPIPQVREALKSALASGRLVEAFTWNVSKTPLPPDHAFAVLGYDSATDTINLWNPWGDNFDPSGPAGPQNGYPRVNGKFQMPLADFVKIFAQLRAETDQPAEMKGPKVFAESGTPSQ